MEDDVDGLLSYTFDHLYACHADEDKMNRRNNNDDGQEEIVRLTSNLEKARKEIAELKDLIFIHLDLIQQQSDELLQKDKDLIGLQEELEKLKASINPPDGSINFRLQNINPPPLIHLNPGQSTSTVAILPENASQMQFANISGIISPNGSVVKCDNILTNKQELGENYTCYSTVSGNDVVPYTSIGSLIDTTYIQCSDGTFETPQNICIQPVIQPVLQPTISTIQTFQSNTIQPLSINCPIDNLKQGNLRQGNMKQVNLRQDCMKKEHSRKENVKHEKLKKESLGQENREKSHRSSGRLDKMKLPATVLDQFLEEDNRSITVEEIMSQTNTDKQSTSEGNMTSAVSESNTKQIFTYEKKSKKGCKKSRSLSPIASDKNFSSKPKCHSDACITEDPDVQKPTKNPQSQKQSEILDGSLFDDIHKDHKFFPTVNYPHEVSEKKQQAQKQAENSKDSAFDDLKRDHDFFPTASHTYEASENQFFARKDDSFLNQYDYDFAGQSIPQDTLSIHECETMHGDRDEIRTFDLPDIGSPNPYIFSNDEGSISSIIVNEPDNFVAGTSFGNDFSRNRVVTEQVNVLKRNGESVQINEMVTDSANIFNTMEENNSAVGTAQKRTLSPANSGSVCNTLSGRSSLVRSASTRSTLIRSTSVRNTSNCGASARGASARRSTSSSRSGALSARNTTSTRPIPVYSTSSTRNSVSSSRDSNSARPLSVYNTSTSRNSVPLDHEATPTRPSSVHRSLSPRNNASSGRNASSARPISVHNSSSTRNDASSSRNAISARPISVHTASSSTRNNVSSARNATSTRCISVHSSSSACSESDLSESPAFSVLTALRSPASSVPSVYKSISRGAILSRPQSPVTDVLSAGSESDLSESPAYSVLSALGSPTPSAPSVYRSSTRGATSNRTPPPVPDVPSGCSIPALHSSTDSVKKEPIAVHSAPPTHSVCSTPTDSIMRELPGSHNTLPARSHCTSTGDTIPRKQLPVRSALPTQSINSISTSTRGSSAVPNEHSVEKSNKSDRLNSGTIRLKGIPKEITIKKIVNQKQKEDDFENSDPIPKQNTTVHTTEEYNNYKTKNKKNKTTLIPDLSEMENTQARLKHTSQQKSLRGKEPEYKTITRISNYRTFVRPKEIPKRDGQAKHKYNGPSNSESNDRANLNPAHPATSCASNDHNSSNSNGKPSETTDAQKIVSHKTEDVLFKDDKYAVYNSLFEDYRQGRRRKFFTTPKICNGDAELSASKKSKLTDDIYNYTDSPPYSSHCEVPAKYVHQEIDPRTGKRKYKNNLVNNRSEILLPDQSFQKKPTCVEERLNHSNMSYDDDMYEFQSSEEFDSNPQQNVGDLVYSPNSRKKIKTRSSKTTRNIRNSTKGTSAKNAQGPPEPIPSTSTGITATNTLERGKAKAVRKKSTTGSESKLDTSEPYSWAFSGQDYKLLTSDIRNDYHINTFGPSQGYYIVGNSADKQNANEEVNLEVPSWRNVDDTPKPVDSNTSEIENIDEDVIRKRHSKLEAVEKRRKRWDSQRYRELYRVNQLKEGMLRRSRPRRGKKNTQNKSKVLPLSLYPSLDDIKAIEIVDELPLSAFGENIPDIRPRMFNLPGYTVRSKSRSKSQKRKEKKNQQRGEKVVSE